MRVFVVDASVAVKWVVAEQMRDKAMLLRGVDQILAPVHWLAESVNVLWAKVARGELQQSEAAERARVLMRAPVITVPLLELTESALDLAFRLRLTVYDTLYVALAVRDAAPLVTADRPLYDRCRQTEDLARAVLWLGDLHADRLSAH